jgi:hypothetical protein
MSHTSKPLTAEQRASKRERDRLYRERVKRECFDAYGGQFCSVEGCHEGDINSLELHHVAGGGNEDRAARIGKGLRSPGGYHFYVKLKHEGYPPGFVVICTHHHDIKHGRYKKSDRRKCAPGEDESRQDDVTPF